MSDSESANEEQETLLEKKSDGSNSSEIDFGTDSDSEENQLKESDEAPLDGNDEDEDSDDDDDDDDNDEDDDDDDDNEDEEKGNKDKKGQKSKVNEPKSKKDKKKHKDQTIESVKTEAPFYEAKNDFIKKYGELRGKQLFLRFPKNLPKKEKEVEEYVKQFNERIINVIRPRQKSTRHCIVQFDNENDRTKAMKQLSKVEVEGSKLIVELPKVENKEYLEKLVIYHTKKQQKIIEIRKTKKLAKQQVRIKNYTSTLHVSNIPSSATAADIKALFPEATELRFTVAKGMENTSHATVTLPSAKDATEAKRQKHKIAENVLVINFATVPCSMKDKNDKQKGKKNKKKNKSSIKLTKDNNQGKKQPKRKLTGDNIDQNNSDVSPKKKKKNENLQNKKPEPEKVQQNNLAKSKKNKNKQENKMNSGGKNNIPNAKNGSKGNKTNIKNGISEKMQKQGKIKSKA